MHKPLLWIARVFLTLAIIIIVAKPRGSYMDKLKEVVSNGLSTSNLLESKTSSASYAIAAVTLEQYFNLLPEHYRPWAWGIAGAVLFFFNTWKNPRQN